MMAATVSNTNVFCRVFHVLFNKPGKIAVVALAACGLYSCDSSSTKIPNIAHCVRTRNLDKTSYFYYVAFYSTPSDPSRGIQIPKRKERGPTDILQTLASTLKRDPTAAHYKYHDDPYLIPMSNVGKRTFALAQEAGRKAAKWIVNEHSEWFQHKVAQPPIEIFHPKAVYNESSDVGEDTLLKVIGDGPVGDALIIYDLLNKKGTELSEETIQSLLELVCFYNGEDGIPEELIEERWFSQSNKGKSMDSVRKTWNDNGVADAIFKSLKKPSSEAYSVIIQGMVKFGQIERAWQLFETAKEKAVLLDIGVYNALLSAVNALKQGPDQRWQLAQDLLSGVATAKLKPNIGTMNAVLLTISGLGGGKAAELLRSTLSEFRHLGVEPSLGSFYYVLFTYSRDRLLAPSSGAMLNEILNEISGKHFKIQHSSDTGFFVKAMEICRHQAQDIDLARRVDDLLHTGDNYNLIGDSFEESIYYRNFFLLLCTTESIDRVMETYNLLVPHIYTPEPSVMQELIRAVDLSGDVTLFPRLWSDITLFDHADRENILAQLLDTLVRNQPAPDSPLILSFADIARQIWDKIENQPANRTNVISWSGEMLSNVMILFARSENLDLASQVMQKLNQENAYLGEPVIDALSSYVDLCIGKNEFIKALDCLNYCKRNGRTELITMAKDLRSRLTLTDEQAQQLSQLLDAD